VREKGFKQRYDALATQRDLFAFSLLRPARARNDVARLHHFETAADEAYFGSFLNRTEVDGLLAAPTPRRRAWELSIRTCGTSSARFRDCAAAPVCSDGAQTRRPPVGGRLFFRVRGATRAHLAGGRAEEDRRRGSGGHVARCRAAM
jgi:hypothetical protein